MSARREQQVEILRGVRLLSKSSRWNPNGFERPGQRNAQPAKEASAKSRALATNAEDRPVGLLESRFNKNGTGGLAMSSSPRHKDRRSYMTLPALKPLQAPQPQTKSRPRQTCHRYAPRRPRQAGCPWPNCPSRIPTTLPWKIFMPLKFQRLLNAPSPGRCCRPACDNCACSRSRPVRKALGDAEGLKIADHLLRIDEVISDCRVGENPLLGRFDDICGGGQEPARLSFEGEILRLSTVDCGEE